MVARSFGGPEVLTLVHEDSIPQPGPDEVRLRVLAAGVGYTDTIVRRGKYRDYRAGLPCTPGYDVVGTVDAVGAGADPTLLGRLVADMPVHGSYTQYAVRPADGVVPVPDGLSPAHAIDVPLMWTTAWQMLTRVADVRAGDQVLVVGAAGSVGRALVRLAQHLGATVVGTGSPASLAAIEAAGATALDRHSDRLAEEVRAATGGRGVDAAFDGVGLASFRSSWSSLAPGGTLVGYGFSDFLDTGAPTWRAALDMLAVTRGYTLRGRLDRTRRTSRFYDINRERRRSPENFRTDVAHLLDLMAGGMVPPEPRVLPLARAAEAHRLVAQGGLGSRIVLDPWLTTPEEY